MERTICQHCKDRYTNRHKNLCWRCYYTTLPDGSRLRDHYPSVSKFVHRGLGFANTMPPHPTKTLPGTRFKLMVLEWRAKNGFRIFHDEDVTLFSQPEERIRPVVQINRRGKDRRDGGRIRRARCVMARYPRICRVIHSLGLSAEDY